MNNLIKAMKCRERWYAEGCNMKCDDCEFNQGEYVDTSDIYNKAIIEIVRLEKSNRNWRRKVQRLRHELKEVKEHGIP